MILENKRVGWVGMIAIKCTLIQLKKIVKEEGWKSDLDLEYIYDYLCSNYNSSVCIDQTGTIGYEELFRIKGCEIIDFSNSKYNNKKNNKR